MPIPPYIAELRRYIGTALLLVTAADAIVRDDAGRILILRRQDNGRWDLPGGIVDPGEAPAQALVREVWEEAGLRVVPERLAGIFGGVRHRNTYPNGDQLEYTVSVFVCRIVGGQLEARDGEATGFAFVAPEELPALYTDYPAELFASLDRPAPAIFQWDPTWLDDLA